MLLETARRYNHETECITFLKDFTYSKDDFHRAGEAKGRLGGGGWAVPMLGPCWPRGLGPSHFRLSRLRFFISQVG